MCLITEMGPADSHEFFLQGEEHRLFWPSQAEFVRLAAQFNATIVPFGVVGEDDLLEVCSAISPAVFQLVRHLVKT